MLIRMGRPWIGMGLCAWLLPVLVMPRDSICIGLMGSVSWDSEANDIG
jgi:hypothetical protein